MGENKRLPGPYQSSQSGIYWKNLEVFLLRKSVISLKGIRGVCSGKENVAGG